MSRVVFLFRGGRAQLTREVRAGDAPDDFLYGMNHFPSGFETGFIEAAAGDGPLLRRLLRPVEIAARGILRVNFGLSNAVVHRRRIAAADVLISTTDGNTLPLLARRKFLHRPTPVIGITQGLFEFQARCRNEKHRAAVTARLHALLRHASHLVVLGEGDRRGLENCFRGRKLPPVTDCQFGVDVNFWCPAPDTPRAGVLSVGSDAMRDFETLMAAVREWPLRIVTRLGLDRSLAGPQTTIDGNVDYRELRRLYQSAACVVVPVKDQDRDSGHSVVLQAMACGRPVVLSETRGLWDRKIFAHGDTLYLVPPGDPAAMRRQVHHVLTHRDEAEAVGRRARAAVEAKYTSRHFGAALASIARGCLE